MLKSIANFPRRTFDSIMEMLRRGDLLVLALTFALLLMPALALQTAEWPMETRTVIPVLVVSTLFGYILARSQYNELLALIVSSTYGFITILVIAGWNESGNVVDGVVTVIVRFLQWLFDLISGGINQDTLAFTVLVASLFWFLAYNAVWHIFRLDRIWRVILPPAVILLINLAVYNGEAHLEIYLALFVLISLLLMVRSSLEAREWDWYINGIRAPKHLRQRFFQVGAVLSLVVMLFAWFIPTGNLQDRLNNFQEFLNSDPMRQVAEFFNRLIQPIESDGPATADYYGGDALSLGGAIRLGDQPVVFVAAPNDRRFYWRSRVFEVYDNGRWSPSAALRVPDLTPPLEILMDDEVIGRGRIQVQQTFTIGTGGSRLIYTAPQPLQVSIEGRIDLLRTNPALESASPMNISVIRPTHVLERGTTYDVTSLMSVATANELRGAPTNYPLWVQQPNAFPGIGYSARVGSLAREIVTATGATTPYDQAKAIETWLRTNITYNERIPAPPGGVDPLEWFLFDYKQGYCTYYASSMIVMLRTLQIPARMAAGFAQGEYDPSLGQFVVRERDAHTWVEVYFPGYGWVEFEPTSAQQPLNREGDNVIEAPPQAQANEPPTATPSDTPTLIPSPTPFATHTPPPNQSQPLDPPTMTPTPSPTPTATPVIIPTVAPPVRPPEPPSSDFLSFLLPAFGAALLLFLLVVLVVLLGMFIYWWWEWRGMGGLSPVARAYARLERYLRLVGIIHTPEETPEERRERIVKKLPPAERPVTAITRTYSQERYGKPTEGTPEGARNARIAENAWKEARKNILQRWSRWWMFWRRRG